MKTPEELNALKEEVEALNKKLAELSGEELAEVTGGLFPLYPPIAEKFRNIFDGNAKVVKIGLDPASNPHTAAVNEKDEQIINFDF